MQRAAKQSHVQHYITRCNGFDYYPTRDASRRAA